MLLDDDETFEALMDRYAHIEARANNTASK